MIPVDPYVLDVAAALTAAGHTVTETWTEPVEPVDHCIAWTTADGGTAHLVWDGRWRWFYYPPPSTRGTWPYIFEAPTTGRLAGGRLPGADVVAAAVAALTPTT